MLQVSSFYHFQPLSKAELQALATAMRPFRQRMRGLILLAAEGINATVSGPEDVIVEFKVEVQRFLTAKIAGKDSSAEKHPFREFKIRLRKEIVTLGKPDLVPSGPNGHLSPKEWQAAMTDPDALVLDTRNRYEVDIGKFDTAADLNMSEFGEFPERIRELNLPKEKKILMYCTGGIRCEKAALEMRAQGYENVFQLQGGILEYLKEYPNERFQGECFVFDYRVAVDQELSPSQQYRLCPHCGQPGGQKLNCVRCGTETIVCEKCRNLSPAHSTCSKNCSHHEHIQSRSKKSHAQELRKRQLVER